MYYITCICCIGLLTQQRKQAMNFYLHCQFMEWHVNNMVMYYWQRSILKNIFQGAVEIGECPKKNSKKGWVFQTYSRPGNTDGSGSCLV